MSNLDLRALVLHGRGPKESRTSFNPIWVFFLDQRDEKATRLLIRFRLDHKPNLLNAFFCHVLPEPAHYGTEDAAEYQAAGPGTGSRTERRLCLR